ncbi:pyrolysin [Thermococcus sp.]
MRKTLALGVILMLALIPATASVKAAEISGGSGVVGAALAWYYLYLHENKTFSELYNLSVQNGVDNKTLSLAYNLSLNASKEFKTALSFGTPEKATKMRWLPFMMNVRKAYLDIMKASELLRNALEKKGIEISS